MTVCYTKHESINQGDETMRLDTPKYANVAAIDRNLLAKATGNEYLADLVFNAVEVVRNCIAASGCTVISAKPTMILAGPNKDGEPETYIRAIVDGNVRLTCDPTEAQEYYIDWAKENAPRISNGNGQFIAMNERDAIELAIEKYAESAIFYINSIIEADTTDLKSWDQVQGNYFGQFFKLDNKAVA